MPSEIRPAITPVKSVRDTPGERAWLSCRAEDVCALAYRSATDAVRIGMILEDVRGRVGRGGYEAWVKAELPFSVSTATRYRQVAAAFGQFEAVHFERFDPSALYVLAQLAVPEAAREHAVQLTEDGQRITHATALSILDAHKPVADDDDEGSRAPATEPPKLLRCLGILTDKETKEKCQCPVKFLTTAGNRFCPKCRAADNPERAKPTAPEMLAKRWEALLALVGDSSEVRITKVEDTDDPDPLYSVTCHRPDDRPHNIVRRELYDALAVLAGKEETRFCSGYKPLFPEGHDVPLGQFGKNDTNPEGLMYRCRVCEKARRAQMRKDKRAEKERAKQGPQSGLFDSQAA